MDWFSRFVLSWHSRAMEVRSVSQLWKALASGPPEIFNSDQVAVHQRGFTGALKERDIDVSMDGRGEFDNIFIERLWRR